MLLVVEAGKWRRLHAKERMAAADMWAAHLEIHQTLEFLESAKKWRIQPSKKKIDIRLIHQHGPNSHLNSRNNNTRFERTTGWKNT
jgi:hypothetical protein